MSDESKYEFNHQARTRGDAWRTLRDAYERERPDNDYRNMYRKLRRDRQGPNTTSCVGDKGANER